MAAIDLWQSTHIVSSPILRSFYLFIYFSQTFSGTIPEELGELESVVNVYLHENKLRGSLPSTLIKLSQLGSLRLYENDLTGDISPDLCELKSHSSLGYIAADCVSKMECTCCDKCY